MGPVSPILSSMIGGLCPVAPCDSLRRCVSIPSMVNTLKNAIDEIATLPETDQEEIARQILAHVEKIRRLRTDLQSGVKFARRWSRPAARYRWTWIARARHRGGR